MGVIRPLKHSNKHIFYQLPASCHPIQSLACRTPREPPPSLAIACGTSPGERSRVQVADAHRHLDGIAERIEGLETRVLDGDPRRAIIEEAKREHADLIVIGKRGRNRIQEFLLGSTAEAIARDAHCPVLLVPKEKA